MKNFQKLTTEEILKEIELLDTTFTNINNEILKDKLEEIILTYINYLKPIISLNYNDEFIHSEFIKEITKK